MSAEQKPIEAQADHALPLSVPGSPPGASIGPGEEASGTAEGGEDAVRPDAQPNAAPGANGYAADYYVPYASTMPPAIPWDPAYGSASPYPPFYDDGAEPRSDFSSGPALAPQDAPLNAYAPQSWVPNAQYDPGASITDGDLTLHAGSATAALPAYSPEPMANGYPMPHAEPVVEYGMFGNVPAPSLYYAGTAMPPGMMAPPEMAPPPMPLRDEELAARVTALEWHAYEMGARSRDTEIDLLMHKVSSLEEMMMRFLSEVPIRLGGEIGMLERRVTYLSEELPARLQAESGASAEQIERLGQKVAAVEAFVQAMPSVRWHQEQNARSEALERRVVELEQFCTALARKGTAPREVAASTVEDGGSLSGGPAAPRMSSRAAQAREAERRRPRQ